MNYVMVPVPEELAPKVLDYVRWKGDPVDRRRQPAAPEAARSTEPSATPVVEDEPLPRVFAGLDAASRRFVAVVATASLEQAQLTVPEAARRAGLGTREALGLVVELNNLIAGAGGPPLAVVVKGVDGTADVEFTWNDRIVVMPEAVARPLADLARAAG